MAEPTAISGNIEPVTLITSTMTSIHWSWWTSRLFCLLILPFKGIWKITLLPLKLTANVFLIVFAPVSYILLYVSSWIQAVWTLFAAFEPLYIFFGVAAFVGIIAGIILAVSSAFITSYLGIHQEAPLREPSQRSYLKGTGANKDESSSNGDDWQWTDTSSPTRRRPPSGLLSQTILEEDDSSEGLL